MTKDEALDLALEAIQSDLGTYNIPPTSKMLEAITAIKQALALDKMAENARELGLDYEPVGEAYLCDKCQTPFDGAWECPNCGHRSATKESVYTTPPAAQRQWVGLSEEEIDKLKHLIDWTATWSHGRFAYEIEQLLKEKNA